MSFFPPLSLRFNGVWPACRFLGVPPGRGSCPLTGPLPFDLIYTDYHGLQQMKQHMGLSLRKHKSVVSALFIFFLPSLPSFFARASRRKPPFVSLLGSKRRVFVRWIPSVLPVIASLIKHFIIGLLAGWRHRPVTFFFFFFCVSKILSLGEIQFGLFAQWSIKQELFLNAPQESWVCLFFLPKIKTKNTYLAPNCKKIMIKYSLYIFECSNRVPKLPPSLLFVCFCACAVFFPRFASRWVALQQSPS